MADDDNFDIDIYGDDEQDLKPEPQPEEVQKQPDTDYNSGLDGTNYGQQPNEPETEPPIDADPKLEGDPDEMKVQYEKTHGGTDTSGLQEQQQILSTTGSSTDQYNAPKQAPTEQGTKRKEGEDTRDVDPGATSALKLGELQWWISEDDIRGWANQCGCEDELKEVTFNEHKVNGKSKGEAFVELASPQAATALKRRIDSFGADQQYVKKHTCIYSRPDYNPFKTSPKDAPQRNKVVAPGAYNNGPAFQSGAGGFRGGRGGYNRGGMNNMNTGMNMNGMGRGNFNNPQMNMMGGFNGGGMGGNFNNNNMMGGFNNAMGGFNNRGGMMGGNMRGGFQNNRGRGGMMMPNMNMGMGNMGNMGMNNMSGMNNMGAMGAMGMGNMNMGGFGNNTQGGHFNPGFFGNGGAANGTSSGGSMSPTGNPHGAKRPRPE